MRWVSDPQPAYDPGATGELFVTLWTFRDDGPTAARGPPRGPAVEQASDPRMRGDAKRLLVRTGFWRQMDNQRARARGQRASIGVRLVDGLASSLAYECIG